MSSGLSINLKQYIHTNERLLKQLIFWIVENGHSSARKLQINVLCYEWPRWKWITIWKKVMSTLFQVPSNILSNQMVLVKKSSKLSLIKVAWFFFWYCPTKLYDSWCYLFVLFLFWSEIYQSFTKELFPNMHVQILISGLKKNLLSIMSSPFFARCEWMRFKQWWMWSKMQK